MSLKLVEGVKTFKIRHMQEEQLKLRIGVHTGIVRLVGNKHISYHLQVRFVWVLLV